MNILIRKSLVIPLISASVAFLPQASMAAGKSLTLDILSLNIDSQNYDYAITGYGAPGVSLFNGDIQRIEPESQLGFRLAFDTGGPLVIKVTSISADETDTTTGAANVAGTQFHSDWSSSLNVETLNSAEAEVTLDYKTIDLELGSDLTLGGGAQGRVHAGFRVMDLDNDLDVTYNDGTNIADINQEQSFTGFGVKTGLDTKWSFGVIKVVAGAAFSLLSGDIDTSSKESDTGNGLIYSVSNTDTAVLNVTEANIGVEYTLAKMDIGLGYEYTNVQGLYRDRYPDDVIDSALNNAPENLSMSGLYLRGRMSF